MIRQAPCSESSSAERRTATTTPSRSWSRAEGASARWLSASSTTSTGWLPDACRADIAGTLVGSDTVLDQTVEASHGYHVFATVMDAGPTAATARIP